MTTTLDKPITDEGVEDDFAPKCVFVHEKLGQVISECDRPAAWVGFLPCCGDAALACDGHRHSHLLIVCGQCKRRHIDLINWSRL